jgi:mannose-6-phosphate isomerase-like protein (cupin superfamily)
MPIVKSGNCQMPAWCELEFFEIVQLEPGTAHRFERCGQREKLILADGRCTVCYENQKMPVGKGANLDLSNPHDRFEISDVSQKAIVVRMCGRWKLETGGSGLFSVSNSLKPMDDGDPCSYPKTTNFDRHYHDCDEYWILVEGEGLAVSEDKFYQLRTGDCLVTGMGHHHDFPEVYEPVSAIYFETTLEGRKRLGHLWNHRDGCAEPKADRI